LCWSAFGWQARRGFACRFGCAACLVPGTARHLHLLPLLLSTWRFVVWTPHATYYLPTYTTANITPRAAGGSGTLVGSRVTLRAAPRNAVYCCATRTALAWFFLARLRTVTPRVRLPQVCGVNATAGRLVRANAHYFRRVLLAREQRRACGAAVCAHRFWLCLSSRVCYHAPRCV